MLQFIYSRDHAWEPRNGAQQNRKCSRRVLSTCFHFFVVRACTLRYVQYWYAVPYRYRYVLSSVRTGTGTVHCAMATTGYEVSEIPAPNISMHARTVRHRYVPVRYRTSSSTHTRKARVQSCSTCMLSTPSLPAHAAHTIMPYLTHVRTYR